MTIPTPAQINDALDAVTDRTDDCMALERSGVQAEFFLKLLAFTLHMMREGQPPMRMLAHGLVVAMLAGMELASKAKEVETLERMYRRSE